MYEQPQLHGLHDAEQGVGQQGLTSARNPPRLLAYCRIKKRTPPRWYCRRYLLMQAGTVSSSSLPAAKVHGKLERPPLSRWADLKQAVLYVPSLGFAARTQPWTHAWCPLVVGGDKATPSLCSAHMTWLSRQTGTPLPCPVRAPVSKSSSQPRCHPAPSGQRDCI